MLDRGDVFVITLLVLFCMMVGCHHRQPAPYIDPSKELTDLRRLPQTMLADSPSPMANVAPPARAKREVIHDAKIPMSCVADLDQEQSDCRMTGNPTVARCNNMLVRFSCLSYRQQKKTVDKTVKDGETHSK